MNRKLAALEDRRRFYARQAAVNGQMAAVALGTGPGRGVADDWQLADWIRLACHFALAAEGLR